MRKTLLALCLALASPALAAVSSTSSFQDYTGNGATTAFAFTFPTLTAGDVEVLVGGVKQTLGVTVTLNANQATSPGGTALFATAPANLAPVRVQRTVALTQGLVLQPYSAFPAKSVEKALDRLAMQAQQLERDRAALAATHAADKAAQAARDATQDLALSYGSVGGNATLVTAADTSTTKTLADWMEIVLTRTTAGSINASFSQPGCFSNPVATYNIPMTPVRAGTAYVALASALLSCNANQLRISDQVTPPGGLIERATTNLVPVAEDFAIATGKWSQNAADISVTVNNATDPAGGTTADTITKSAAGAKAIFYEIAAGSVQAVQHTSTLYVRAGTTSTVSLGIMQAGGGINDFVPSAPSILSGPGRVASGEHGSVNNDGLWVIDQLSTTEWTRVGLTTKAVVQAGVALVPLQIYPAGPAAGTGTLLVWGATAHGLPYATSYHATTKAADNLSMSNPFSTADFCVKGRFLPEFSRAWTATTAALFSLGTEGASASGTLVAHPDGTLRWTVVDANGGTRQVSATHGFGVGSSHEVAACANQSGALSLWADGTQLSSAASGGGSGILSPQPTTLWIGTNGASLKHLDGYVSDFRVSPQEFPDGMWNDLPGAATYRVLWASDSIYNAGTLWDVTTAASGADLVHDTATYGGNVIGGGLLELADTTYSYESAGTGWALRGRGRPFSAYSALVFEFGRNDANNREALAAYTNAYDKILAQGVKYFPKVISGTPPPRAAGDLSAWDLANDVFVSGGYSAAVPALVAKWGSQHVNNHQALQTDVTLGNHTVAQLMRDTWHPSYGAGMTLIGGWIASAYSSAPTLIAATPTIAGEVRNYLFGQPTAGTWALTAGLVSSTGPTQSPLWRIADYPDMANVAQASGAKLSFPAFTCQAGGCQVWAHFLVDSATGGTATIYVDRGTGSQVSVTKGTLAPGLNLYEQAILVANGLAAGVHQVELETTDNGPVRVLGVTYVGAQ